jgi:hypothetical protein
VVSVSEQTLGLFVQRLGTAIYSVNIGSEGRVLVATPDFIGLY